MAERVNEGVLMHLGANTFYHGDCLFVLTHDIPAESVDLIYLDPPFFTGKVQKGKWQPGAMEVSFEDSKRFWKDKGISEIAPEWMKHIAIKRPDFASYLYYMMGRLQACHKALKKTGSIYLHCDYRASHYLKMVMDEIFDADDFVDEIVWCYEDIGGRAVDYFKRKHDTILFYQKTNERFFCIQYKPLSESTIKRYQKYFDSRGQITYRRLLETNPGVFKKLKGVPDDLDQVWLDINKGQPFGDWWADISAIRRGFRESAGFPTQKPEALLERIIKASSKEGDLVLDPFCGCGTAVIVASKLNRRFIGIDIDTSDRKKGELPTAFQVIKNRSHELFNQSRYVSRDLKEVLEMNAKEFEDWVNEFYSATKPLPDIGVDGITNDGIPIQTKTGQVDYGIVSQFLSDAQLHPKVPQPVKKMMMVSQAGFDDSARKRAFEIKAKFGIEIQLKEPKELLEI